MSSRCEILEAEIRDLKAQIDELQSPLEARPPWHPDRRNDDRRREQLKERLRVKEQQLIVARRKGGC